jgi:sulfoxide reductase heme-binding subunit YedZ
MIENHPIGVEDMVWLKSNWRGAALNLFGSSVVVGILAWGSRDMNNTNTFDPGLESGKWAIRFLLICLAMTPLNTCFNWRGAIKLRKPAGLWAFGFAALHVLYTVGADPLAWLGWPMQPFIALGLLGFCILSMLALTSNRWSMQRLRKQWKRLHRLVYLAGVAVTSHAILATSASKKLLLRDPQALEELNIYLAVLVVLLVVRIPLVRRVLKPVIAVLWPARRDEPITISVPIPEYRPRVWSRQTYLPLDERCAEVQPEAELEPAGPRKLVGAEHVSDTAMNGHYKWRG